MLSCSCPIQGKIPALSLFSLSLTLSLSHSLTLSLSLSVSLSPALSCSLPVLKVFKFAQVQADILTNPSISSYRFGNGSVTSFSNNNSRRGSLGSGLAPDDGRPAQESASVASHEGALEASGGCADERAAVATRLAGPSRFLDVAASASGTTFSAAAASTAENTAEADGAPDAAVGRGENYESNALYSVLRGLHKLYLHDK